MTGPDPGEFTWWLASRASGVVALLAVAISVGLGLAMAGRVARPGHARTLVGLHRQTALVGLVAMAVHGITLLGDAFLSPSIGDIVLPFTSRHEPLWTGLGVTGGWLAAILGLSFWVRHRIGAGLWRRLHRATILVYVLSVAHTLGAGTDAAEPWMLALLLTTGVPVLFLFLMRVLTPRPVPAFRRFRVVDVRPESASVLSFDLQPVDGKPVAPHAPGQFVPVRVPAAGGTVTRSYSVSCAPRPDGLRISVRREPGGRLSDHLHRSVVVGDELELGRPAGAFVLGPPAPGPLVLVSAGVGATPLLAMLEALARERSARPVWWIHSARDGSEHAFRGEVRARLAALADGRQHVRYTRPRGRDRAGHDFDAAGRLTAAGILALGVPATADFRLCGPTTFVADLVDGLAAAGVDRSRLAWESFGGPPPGPPRAPAGVAAAAGDGPVVEFSRSGISARFGPAHGSLLEVAEASAVAVPSGCRIGACHGCRAGVLAGRVRHDPEPLEPPPAGSALLCCAVPEGDVVLDA